jgi:hypothetical protein
MGGSAGNSAQLPHRSPHAGAAVYRKPGDPLSMVSKYRATEKSTCFQLVRLAASGKGKKISSFPAPLINDYPSVFPRAPQ